MARTLLVLGNGFDLKIGLKSSFRGYLDSVFYQPKIDIVHEIYDLANQQIRTIDIYPPQNPISEPMRNLFTQITFWDLYYAIPHIYKFRNVDYWYDFESQLLRFIASIENDYNDYKEIITTNNIEAHNRIQKEDEQKTVYDFILHQYLECYEKEAYKYDKLLKKDMVKYEKDFGNYIALQQKSFLEYDKISKEIIQKLVGDGNLVYVNTFNYTNLKKAVSTECDIWHVNGDFENPIFGIDYTGKDPVNSKWFTFSKTYRRLELHGNDLYFPKNKEFSKVVIYGHSLNRQDYNYFYALFNRINLSNDRGKRNGYTVEFVYSKYPGKESDDARQETIERVLKLFQGYNKEILHEENFRLMDILFSNGAVKFREI